MSKIVRRYKRILAAVAVATSAYVLPAQAQPCLGDCNNNGMVSASELTKIIAIINLCPCTGGLIGGLAEGCAAVPGGADKQCTAADRNGNGCLSAAELTGVIQNLLTDPITGCPSTGPTVTPTTGGSVPTNTPTNPPVEATHTPTSPPQPTNTPTVLAPTVTPSPTPSPTQGSGTTQHIVIAPGGGSRGNCRGTCVGGANMGQPCGYNTDCPGSTCGGTRMCVGGPYNGLTCTGGSANAEGRNCSGCEPNRICTGAGVPLPCCTGALAGTCPLVGSCAIIQGSFPVRVSLNGVCGPRSYPPGDVSCVTDAECRVCMGGENAGKVCFLDTHCPESTCGAFGSGTCMLNELDLEIGQEDANGERPLVIPQSSVQLNPAVVSGIGAVCVNAGGKGAGIIDCNGGRANINATLSRDHNTNGTNNGPVGRVCSSTAGANAGKACTANNQCSPGQCVNGNSGSTATSCSAPASGNGFFNDSSCTCTFTLPDGSISRACLEGTKQCSGGSNEGTLCMMDTDCTGGGTCSFCNVGTNGGPHVGVCNSPTHTVLGGTFAAGDLVTTLPLSLTVLAAPADPPPANWGPDGLPCTGDETVDPSNPVLVLLSSGTNNIFVYDAGNAAGNVIGPGSSCGGTPCVAGITGKGVSCPNLTSGNFAGTTLGGGFPALDTPAGDIATVFQFTFQQPNP